MPCWAEPEGDEMRRIAIAACAALALFLAGAASAQTEKWDQKKVTALSAQFMNAVSGLQTALRQNPQMQDPTQEYTLGAVTDTLNLLEFESTHLNAMLTKGAGMRGTLHAYYRLQELVQELVPYQGQVMLTDFLTPPIQKGRTALVELAKYYPPVP